MQQSISGNGNFNLIEKECTVAGFHFSLGVANSGVTIDPENITINAALVRKNQTTIVMSGNLYAIAKANSPAAGEGTFIGPTGGASAGFYGYECSLKGVVNLKGYDSLNITITVGGSNTAVTTTCSTTYGVGVEVVTPVCTVYNVQVNQSNQTIPMGPNVNSIAVIQSAPVLSANKNFVLNSFNLDSDKWAAQYVVANFVALIANQWPVGTNPTNYSFIVYNNFYLNGARLSINVNTIAAGFQNCYIVVYGGDHNPSIKQRAQALTARITQTNMNQYGV